MKASQEAWAKLKAEAQRRRRHRLRPKPGDDLVLSSSDDDSLRPSASAAAEHAREDTYKILETMLERIGAGRMLMH